MGVCDVHGLFIFLRPFCTLKAGDPTTGLFCWHSHKKFAKCNDYLTNDYPTNDYLTTDYLTTDYPTTDYPTTRLPTTRLPDYRLPDYPTTRLSDYF